MPARRAVIRGAHRSTLAGVRIPNALSRPLLWLAVALSGVAGLSWEILWQHHVSLALGLSVQGAAITLAALMAGLGLGAHLASRLARAGKIARPLRAYAVAELVVGAGGLAVAPALSLVALADTALFARSPLLASLVQTAGISLPLLVPATAMGATIPLLAGCAGEHRTSVGTLYALNTAGAVVGVVAGTFALLPAVGVASTAVVAAAVNLAAACIAMLVDRRIELAAPAHREPARVDTSALALAFLSGFVTFVLEVSWFRSIRAAYQATTETFAVVLAAFLLPLAVAGAVAKLRVPTWDPRRALGVVLAMAGMAILFATPLVDGLDQLTTGASASPITPLVRGLTVAAILAMPVFLLGLVFPTLLELNASTEGTGKLYAANTIGAVSGALAAGFLLLPSLGATRTSWLAGLLACAGALLCSRAPRRIALTIGAAALGLAVALAFDVGSARTRVQGFLSIDFGKVLYVAEGPDATVWVTTERRTRARRLVIDGFVASGEGLASEHYMAWMGNVPALATTSRDRALVICFGTGQTVNAVRRQGFARVDVAEVSASVLRAAPLFSRNEGVLHDRRVHAVVMDGRALLRRSTDARYDVVTLEPMPPNFAGANNLYSSELYALARSRLSPHGVVAQWLPLHLVSQAHMRAIMATFLAAFPHARLWMDPVGGTGVLVGALVPWRLQPSPVPVDLDASEIANAFLLGPSEIRRASRGAELVTDDNQLLSYGLDRLTRSTLGRMWSRELYRLNLAYLERFRAAPRAAR